MAKKRKKRIFVDPELVPAITLEVLNSTPDGSLDYIVFNYVHSVVFASPRKFDAAFARLPKGLQYSWLVTDINYQVPNGGFHQFFYNSSGDRATETVEALYAIGAKKAGRLLEKAIKLFEKRFGIPTDIRKRQYGDWPPDKSIDALDDQFCDIVETGETIMSRYIRKYPEQFLHKRRIKKG